MGFLGRSQDEPDQELEHQRDGVRFFAKTKTSKFSFVFFSDRSCPIPEMHENVWLWNAEDELLHQHQVLQRRPVQHLRRLSMMAPPTRGRRALKCSRSWAAPTHVGVWWMKLHFKWRQNFQLLKRLTNKTILKIVFWYLWMYHCCLGTVYICTVRLLAKCREMCRGGLVTPWCKWAWHYWVMLKYIKKKKQPSPTVIEFSNSLANRGSAALHLRWCGSLSAHTLALVNHPATLKGLTLWIIHSTNVATLAC